jgi:hypothetical protein
MGTHDSFSFDRIEAARQKAAKALEAAEENGIAADISEALLECRDILETLSSQFDADANGRHDGFIPWTFEDESIDPFSREMDVRLYYDWQDYCPGDRITPAYGGFATLSNVEVVAVRYFDEHGREASLGRYHADVAWYLAEQERESLEDACTAAGGSRAVGKAHPLFAPTTPVPAAEESEQPTRRMAPSARKRSSKGHRKLG